jgi:hypothetical protein
MKALLPELARWVLDRPAAAEAVNRHGKVLGA